MVVQNLQQSQILAPTGQYLLQVICGLIELHLSTFQSGVLLWTKEKKLQLNKKAFDSVPHQLLTMKLEGVDLNPVILAWVKNYLAKRS